MPKAARSSPITRARRWTNWVRKPRADRLKRDPYGVYKKGYEVRFLVASKAEVRELRRCLAELGLKPGRPYAKESRWIVPVYGRRAVEIFEGS